MSGSAPYLLLPAFLSGLWPVFGTDPLDAQFPLEAKGDIHFQVDAALFLENGIPIVEVSVALPSDKSDSPQEADSTSFRFTVEMLDKEGEARARYLTELALPAVSPTGSETSFPVPRRWVRLHPPYWPGTAGLRIQVENLGRWKRGLLDRMHQKHQSGEAAARLPTALALGSEARGEPEGRDDIEPSSRLLSDLLFAWELSPPPTGPTEGEGFRAVRSRLIPNPHRYYGRHQPHLTLYWERYPPLAEGGLKPGDPLRLELLISLLPEDKPVLAKAETLEVKSDPEWDLKRFDISGLSTGSYELSLQLHPLTDSLLAAPLAVSRGRFQVIWEEGHWTLDQSQLLAYGRVLLSARDFESFSLLDRGGMEAFLRNLWEREAPTPRGETNPLEQMFHQRVQYAQEHFGGFPRGIQSDRGRVFVRYGQPDEISFQLNPQDEELLWRVLPQEIDEVEQLDDPYSLNRRTRHRTRQDNSAYEIWEYTTRGDPLLPEYMNPGKQIGLKFIFVDELGTGAYSLVYTNLFGGLQ